MKPRLWLVLVAALIASSATAAGITLMVSTRFEFSPCLATGLSADGGSSAQTVTAGSYFFRATKEDVWVCYTSSCADGGEVFPNGMAMQLLVAGDQVMSCRSASSTGVATFTSAQ